MNPSYIATNQEELFDNTPEDIQKLITEGEVNKTTAILGKVYRIPISSYVALSNIISFVLIGAIQPKDVVVAIQDILKLSPDNSFKLAEDLEKSIFEKARISVLGRHMENMVTLTFADSKSSPDELRKEILDTTKRESGIIKNQATPNTNTTPEKEPTVITPGSRSQLLEQLQLLDSIPNDEEVGTRLEHIKDQLASLNNEEESPELDNHVALQEFMFGEKGDTQVEATEKSATYSKAPVKYNVDPYRETAGE